MKVIPKQDELRARGQMKRSSEAAPPDVYVPKRPRVEEGPPLPPGAPMTSLASSLETSLNQCEAWISERLTSQVRKLFKSPSLRS